MKGKHHRTGPIPIVEATEIPSIFNDVPTEPDLYEDERNRSFRKGAWAVALCVGIAVALVGVAGFWMGSSQTTGVSLPEIITATNTVTLKGQKMTAPAKVIMKTTTRTSEPVMIYRTLPAVSRPAVTKTLTVRATITVNAQVRAQPTVTVTELIERCFTRRGVEMDCP